MLGCTSSAQDAELSSPQSKAGWQDVHLRIFRIFGWPRGHGPQIVALRGIVNLDKHQKCTDVHWLNDQNDATLSKCHVDVPNWIHIHIIHGSTRNVIESNMFFKSFESCGTSRNVINVIRSEVPVKSVNLRSWRKCLLMASRNPPQGDNLACKFLTSPIEKYWKINNYYFIISIKKIRTQVADLSIQSRCCSSAGPWSPRKWGNSPPGYHDVKTLKNHWSRKFTRKFHHSLGIPAAWPP